jgi:hypothetical protein
MPVEIWKLNKTPTSALRSLVVQAIREVAGLTIEAGSRQTRYR